MSGFDTGPKGEIELLRRLRAILAAPPPAAGRISWPMVGFGDDMASVVADGPSMLWTVDMLMDGVDFDSRKHSWTAAGRKAMASNLSDCAAMAAQPVAALCAVALNDRMSMNDALELVRGAQECGLRFGCPIVGGDTNSWAAPTVIAITVAARALTDVPPVRRDGARPGDEIWLTGQVGGSILGRHLTFEPRIDLAIEIGRQMKPHAMIDVSDGVALDLGRVMEASGCGAELSEPLVDQAIHPDAERLSAQDHTPAREHALHDGEDFELIVAAPPDARAAAVELGLLPIGRVIVEAGLWLTSPGGGRRAIPLRGWEHFT